MTQETLLNKTFDTFRRQIKELGFSYDWDREVNTTDPKYYNGHNGFSKNFMKKVLHM